ncbi:MAG: putative replication initiation protein [Circoviridae sp.]|nr:MAG: putative replication initiation protein [Circoviridae sp.]
MNKPENCWEKNQCLISDILRKKHICKTYWGYEDKDLEDNGEPKLDAKMVEYWANEACAGGYCEYCYGAQFNEFFTERPTETDIAEYIMLNSIKADVAKKEKRKKLINLKSKGNNEGQLITLCIDHEYIQVPKLATEIISVIKSADYDCLLNAYATIELYGETKKWSPHLHIITRKVKKAGYIAQLFRRKFQKEKYQIYRVDVKDITYENGMNYVSGIKESPEKNEASEMDREYRNENSLENLYEI